jgi:hypothetical protein
MPMNWLKSLWRRSKASGGDPETTTVAHPGERLFSVFEGGSESALLQQCQDDLAAWGFDSFQCRRKAARILANARAAALAETGRCGLTNRPTTTGVAEGPRIPNACSRDGVAPEDSQWYWSLPPLARAVMQEFDKELREAMWFACHTANICLEDLEQDLRRRLPTFGNEHSEDSEDAPLPWELRRRVAAFTSTLGRDEVRFDAWSDRVRQASSMNAVIREEVRAGCL